MNDKIKVGDMVECVDNGGGYELKLTIGLMYKVINLRFKGIKFIDDKGEESGANLYRFKKVEQMTDKKQALAEALAEAQDQLTKAELLVEELGKVETYEVRQEFTSDGALFFNRGRSVIKVTDDGLQVYSIKGQYANFMSQFVWVPIEKRDIESGDVIYSSIDNNPNFDLRILILQMTDSIEGYNVVGTDIKKGYLSSYNFKLTRKEDL